MAREEEFVEKMGKEAYRLSKKEEDEKMFKKSLKIPIIILLIIFSVILLHGLLSIFVFKNFNFIYIVLYFIGGVFTLGPALLYLGILKSMD